MIYASDTASGTPMPCGSIFRDPIFPDFSGIPDFHKSKLSMKTL